MVLDAVWLNLEKTTPCNQKETNKRNREKRKGGNGGEMFCLIIPEKELQVARMQLWRFI